MDQRIGVDAFDRRARAPRTFVRAAERARRLDGQEGSEPFSPAQRRVAHRLDQALGPRRLAWPGFEAEQAFELALDRRLGFG